MQSTTTTSPPPPITATPISQAAFLALLPQPKLAMQFVRSLERTAELFRKFLGDDEPLWLWDYYQLSNGGCYMACDSRSRLRLYVYATGKPHPREALPLAYLNMSAPAFCIVAGLYLFERVQVCRPQFEQLRAFAEQHPEHDAIVQLEHALRTPERIARAPEEITAQPVADAEVAAVMRVFCGEHTPELLKQMQAEVQRLTGTTFKEWNYAQLINGCVYLAPKTSACLPVRIAGTRFTTQLGADAVGIVASFIVFKRLGAERGDFLLEYAAALQQFAMQHPECRLIRAALAELP